MARILIAGATGGIGSRLAERLAARGDTLVLSARDETRLAELAARLPGEGHRWHAADLADPEAVAALFAEPGELDGYAHCVGSILVKPLHLTSEAEARAAFEVNYWSAFRALKTFVAQAIAARRPASAVLVGSLVCDAGFPNHEAIASAKSALVGLAQSAAASYAARGIRVNAVLPGLTDTPLAARFLSGDAARERMASANPMGRVGQAGDIAAAIAWFLSDESAFVTGQTLSVDGGQARLHLPPRL